MNTQRAPWGTPLIVISILTTILCVGIPVAMLWNDPGIPPWLAALPLAIIAGSAPFTIRGYGLTADAVWVRRLCWTTRLPLDGLQSAEFIPNAMRRSLRTCGNGGLFSFTGYYRNKQLGGYRAYVTDLQRTVVLRFPTRTIVVSPADPERFVSELTADRGLRGTPHSAPPPDRPTRPGASD